MASETIIYLHQKGIQLSRDIDLVSFVDYDSEVYTLYADQMDSIIRRWRSWGRPPGTDPQARGGPRRPPIFEKVLTSAYKPYTQRAPGPTPTGERTKRERAPDLAAGGAFCHPITGTADRNRAPGSPANTIVPPSGRVTEVSSHTTEEAARWPSAL